jgi:hypothetical protein
MVPQPPVTLKEILKLKNRMILFAQQIASFDSERWKNFVIKQDILDSLDDLEETPIIVSKLNELNELDVNELNESVTELDADVSNNGVTDYSKLSIKQLKDILTKKGINSNHRMKKTDLINLIEHGHNENTLNLKDEMEEVNI